MKRTLLTFVLVTAGAASASQIACAPDTLDNFLTNFAVCGSITYDFTSGFYTPGGGASLLASDILVTPSGSGINFAVTPGAGGVFTTTGSGNGYSTFGIGYQLSIASPFYFTGITMQANNVHFDDLNGGADTADALKTVYFGSNPGDGGNPYVYSVDAFTGADTSAGTGAVDLPTITDSAVLLPLTTSTMTVFDTITLNPTGTPGESIQSVDNLFTTSSLASTPEPVTLLSMGTALAALGLFRRRTRR